MTNVYGCKTILPSFVVYYYYAIIILSAYILAVDEYGWRSGVWSTFLSFPDSSDLSDSFVQQIFFQWIRHSELQRHLYQSRTTKIFLATN